MGPLVLTLRYMNKSKQDLISHFAKALKKEPGILAAYFFGSYISGYSREGSDLDIAVVVKDKMLASEEGVYGLIKGIELPYDLDLSVVDEKSSPLFLFEIVSHGQRVYSANDLEVLAFEASALNRYYDTRHLRKIYLSYLKEKFSRPIYAN